MGLPSMSQILLELLEGPDAVNPESLQKQVADLQHRVEELQAARQAQVA